MRLKLATLNDAQNGQDGNNGLTAVLLASKGLDQDQDLAIMVMLVKLDVSVTLMMSKIAQEVEDHGTHGTHGVNALRPVLVEFVAEDGIIAVVWNQRQRLKHVTQILDHSVHGHHGQLAQ